MTGGITLSRTRWVWDENEPGAERIEFRVEWWAVLAIYLLCSFGIKPF